MFEKKFRNKIEKISFLKGLGIGKVAKEINRLKEISKHRKDERSIRKFMNLLRMESLQIKKHNRITNKYLSELERLLSKKDKNNYNYNYIIFSGSIIHLNGFPVELLNDIHVGTNTKIDFSNSDCRFKRKYIWKKVEDKTNL